MDQLTNVLTAISHPTRRAIIMTLVHSGLPDSEEVRGHDDGWNYFLDIFPKQFEGSSSKNR